jgi:FkbM family methyltransferase
MREEYLKRPVEIKNTQGFEIYLNPKDYVISGPIAITGTYESGVTRIFKRVLKRGDKVIDVGANIGWFTLLAAGLVGEKGLVMSFEPEPYNFSLLTKSVERNQFSNVVLFKEVASDVDGTKRLNLNEHGNPGAHSIARDTGGESILVQSSRLETAAEKARLDRIDLVKIDAEGAEPQVISGMKSLIADGKVLHMVVEWNPKEWASNSELLSWVFEVFDIYRIDLVRFTKMRKEAIPPSQANMYLVKK